MEKITTQTVNVDNQNLELLLKMSSPSDWKLYINQQIEMSSDEFGNYNDAFIVAIDELDLEDKRILQIGGGDWQIASETYLRKACKGCKVDLVDPLAIDLLRLLQDCSFMQKNKYIKHALDSDFFKAGINPCFVENTAKGVLTSIYPVVFDHFYSSYKRPSFYDAVIVDVSDPIETSNGIPYVANTIYTKEFITKLKKITKAGASVVSYLPGPVAKEYRKLFEDNGFKLIKEVPLGEMFLQDKKNHQESYVTTFTKGS